MERFQVGGGNLPDRFLRAERIQPVAGVAEQSAPHRDARALEQIILPGVNAGNLHLAFAVQFVGGKRRVQQDIGEQIQPGREIAAQHLRVHAKAVVAAVAVNAAADGFNLRGDLFRAARRRALEQRLGEQLRDAVVRGRFRQHAALERRAKFHERQPVILLHQQAQAVRQFKLLDRLVAVRFNRRGNLRRRAVRQQRVERAVFRREIFAGDALDVVRRHALDGGKVALREREIVRREPASAEIVRLAFHRLARGQRGGGELLGRLLHFVGRKPTWILSSRFRRESRRARR